MFPHWGNAFYPFSSVGHLVPQCFGRALGNQRAHWVLSLSKCHDRLFPQCSGRALGDKGLLDFIPFKVGFCVPNALAKHWGNGEPLGFYPFSGVTTLCTSLPCQSIGGIKAPLGSIPLRWSICSPNSLSEHWGDKRPLGLYLAGSSPQTSWY